MGFFCLPRPDNYYKSYLFLQLKTSRFINESSNNQFRCWKSKVKTEHAGNTQMAQTKDDMLLLMFVMGLIHEGSLTRNINFFASHRHGQTYWEFPLFTGFILIFQFFWSCYESGILFTRIARITYSCCKLYAFYWYYKLPFTDRASKKMIHYIKHQWPGRAIDFKPVSA